MGSTTRPMGRRRMAAVTISGCLALCAAAIGGISAADASTPSAAAHAAAAGARGTAKAVSPLLGDLTTYDYNIARSAEDTVDPTIRHLSSEPRWDDTLDGSVYGQPLVYGGFVYVAHGERLGLRALREDRQGRVARARRRRREHRRSSTPPRRSRAAAATSARSASPGTPVIDTATHEIFAAEETAVGGNTWQDIRHWLVAISLTTHRELWHHDIDPPHANNPNYYYIPPSSSGPPLTLFGGTGLRRVRRPQRRLRPVPRLRGRPAGDRARRGRELPGPDPARGRHLGDERRVRLAEGEPLRRDGQRELEHGGELRRGQRRRRAVPVAAPARVLRPEQLGAAQRQRLGPRLGEPRRRPGLLLALRRGQAGPERGASATS